MLSIDTKRPANPLVHTDVASGQYSSWVCLVVLSTINLNTYMYMTEKKPLVRPYISGVEHIEVTKGSSFAGAPR